MFNYCETIHSNSDEISYKPVIHWEIKTHKIDLFSSVFYESLVAIRFLISIGWCQRH